MIVQPSVSTTMKDGTVLHTTRELLLTFLLKENLIVYVVFSIVSS